MVKTTSLIKCLWNCLRGVSRPTIQTFALWIRSLWTQLDLSFRVQCSCAPAFTTAMRWPSYARQSWAFGDRGGTVATLSRPGAGPETAEHVAWRESRSMSKANFDSFFRFLKEHRNSLLILFRCRLFDAAWQSPVGAASRPAPPTQQMLETFIEMMNHWETFAFGLTEVRKAESKKKQEKQEEHWKWWNHWKKKHKKHMKKENNKQRKRIRSYKDIKDRETFDEAVRTEQPLPEAELRRFDSSSLGIQTVNSVTQLRHGLFNCWSVIWQVLSTFHKEMFHNPPSASAFSHCSNTVTNVRTLFRIVSQLWCAVDNVAPKSWQI